VRGDLDPVAVDVADVGPLRRAAALGVDALVQVGPAGRRQRGVGLLPRPPDDGGALVGQSRPAAQRVDVGAQPRVEPRLVEVGRVAVQPLAQDEAGRGGGGGEGVELRPRLLGVDVVGGERADAADVVDAGASSGRDVVERDEVGRRLHPRPAGPSPAG
jgi:hypothetical protein